MQYQTIKVDQIIDNRIDMPVVRVAGEVDIVSSPELKSALNKVIDTGGKHMIVDLSEVTYLDSSGFGMLLSAMKRLRPDGGTITLVGCSEIVDRMIRITRLDTIFGLYTTLDDAVSAIKSRPTK